MKIIDTAQAMPPSGHFVLAWLEGSKIPMRALWADKFSLGVSAEQDPEWGEYCEEKDEYFCPAGWYEMNQHEESHWRVDGNVVAWCELPRLDAGAAPAAVAPQGVAAWMHPETLDVISDAKKHEMSTQYGPETRRKAEGYSVTMAPVEQSAAAPALEAPAAPDAPWCPDVCPITGRPFFMWIDHWQTGKPVPTYGGPYDSYTIPVKDSDGSFECERYDHDEGGWLTEGAGWHCLGVKLVNDQSFVVDPSNPRYNEIEAFAAAAPQAPAPQQTAPQAPAAPVAEIMSKGYNGQVLWKGKVPPVGTLLYAAPVPAPAAPAVDVLSPERMREEFIAWAEVAYRHEEDFSKRDFEICLKAWRFGSANALLAAQAAAKGASDA